MTTVSWGGEKAFAMGLLEARYHDVKLSASLPNMVDYGLVLACLTGLSMEVKRLQGELQFIQKEIERLEAMEASARTEEDQSLLEYYQKDITRAVAELEAAKVRRKK